MSQRLEGREKWLDANGKIVKIDGRKHMLRVSTYRAIYPYPENVITVYAEPINKKSKYYLDTYKILKYDWSTDVLESIELTVDVGIQVGVY